VDKHLRELKRRWEATGAPEDKAALLRAHARLAPGKHSFLAPGWSPPKERVHQRECLCCGRMVEVEHFVEMDGDYDNPCRRVYWKPVSELDVCEGRKGSS
jgi:hypothetical protein